MKTIKIILLLIAGILIGPTAFSQVVIGEPAALEGVEIHGLIHSKSGGIEFPDGTIQTTAADAPSISTVELQYIICISGVYPQRDGGAVEGPMLGEIRLFAGNFVPGGYAACDGSLLPISQHMALFSLLGTMYGGNGSTTFALPDLTAAAPVGPSF